MSDVILSIIGPIVSIVCCLQLFNAYYFIYLFIYLIDAHFTQFQLMYITGSETVANMNKDIKASNESTNRHRIAIHYTGYSEDSAVL